MSEINSNSNSPSRSTSSSVSPPPHPLSFSPSYPNVIFPTPTDKNVKLLNISLCGDHVEWLSIMKGRYNLPSFSSVLYLLLNYIINKLSYFDHKIIFTKIRCRHCGIKFPKVSKNLVLNNNNYEFLNLIIKYYDIKDFDKSIRIILDWVQWGDYKRGMKDEQVKEVVQNLENNIFVLYDQYIFNQNNDYIQYYNNQNSVDNNSNEENKENVINNGEDNKNNTGVNLDKNTLNNDNNSGGDSGSNGINITNNNDDLTQNMNDSIK